MRYQFLFKTFHIPVAYCTLGHILIYFNCSTLELISEDARNQQRLQVVASTPNLSVQHFGKYEEEDLYWWLAQRGLLRKQQTVAATFLFVRGLKIPSRHVLRCT